MIIMIKPTISPKKNIGIGAFSPKILFKQRKAQRRPKSLRQRQTARPRLLASRVLRPEEDSEFAFSGLAWLILAFAKAGRRRFVNFVFAKVLHKKAQFI
jgi:hypothetical protein